MKSTGVVRRIDELGRIVIPKEIRRVLDINTKDPVEIFVDDQYVVLRKYTVDNACMLTGHISDDNIILADGKIILSRWAAESLQDEIAQLLEGEYVSTK